MQINKLRHWVKFKSLELSVFALDTRQSLRVSMVTNQADVYLQFPKLQLFTDLHSHLVESWLTANYSPSI